MFAEEKHNFDIYVYLTPLGIAFLAYGFFLLTINYFDDELIMFYNYKKFPFYHWFYNEWGLGHGYYRPLQVICNYPLMQLLEMTGFRYGYGYNLAYVSFTSVLCVKLLKNIQVMDSFLVVILTAIMITGKSFISSFVFLTDNASLLLSVFFLYITYMAYVKKNISAFSVILLTIASPFLKESGLVMIPYYLCLALYLKHNFRLKEFLTNKATLFFVFYSFVFLLIRKFAVEHSGLQTQSAVGTFPLITYSISSVPVNALVNVVCAVLDILNLEILYLPFVNYGTEVTFNACIRLGVIGFLWALIYYLIVINMTKDTFRKILPLLIMILFNGLVSYSGVIDRIYVSGLSALIVLIALCVSNVERKNFLKTVLILILLYQTYICVRSSYKYYYDSIHYNPSFGYSMTETDIRNAITKSTGDTQIDPFIEHLKSIYPPLRNQVKQ